MRWLSPGVVCEGNPDEASFFSADGETNLKLRDVHTDLVNECSDGAFHSTGQIECDLPNDKLEVFEGRLEMANGHKIPLGARNVLLRGCTLRQTEWVVGVVVYAGAETKVQMNASTPPRKNSALMIYANTQTKYAIGVMVRLCLSPERDANCPPLFPR